MFCFMESMYRRLFVPDHKNLRKCVKLLSKMLSNVVKKTVFPVKGFSIIGLGKKSSI